MLGVNTTTLKKVDKMNDKERQRLIDLAYREFFKIETPAFMDFQEKVDRAQMEYRKKIKPAHAKLTRKLKRIRASK